MPKNDRVLLRRWHLILSIVVLIIVPVASAVGGYYSRVTAVHSMISAMNIKISELGSNTIARFSDERRQSSERYASKQAISKVQKKIERMADDVSWIRGYLDKHRK